MNGAEAILECLKKENVDTIFGYPGATVLPIYDALYDYEKDITHIRTAHEQGAVHAADGYARSTGKVGVCILTSGPGATNSITGVATAFMDSIPLVVISGQVPTNLMGKDSFQEIDITGATVSVCKHNYIIKNIDDLVNTIREAFRVANEGRRGPVYIDIPKDILSSKIDFNVDDYIPHKNMESEKKEKISHLEEAVSIINNSKKAIIYAGGGVKASKSEALLSKFAHKIDTPVLNTLMGLGNIDRNDDLSLGMIGMHGSREGNFAISNSDLVIGIGVRFSDRGLSKNSDLLEDVKIIHIDVDQSEFDKNLKTQIQLVGYMNNILEQLIEMVDKKDNSKWKEEIESFVQEEKIREDEFHPKNILDTINKKLGNDVIVATDVGQHQMWTAKYWKFIDRSSFITSGGLGTMGFGLGAAIGAKIGNPDKRIVLITGDGSFRMNCNELATVFEYNIPITIVLLNNNTLGMVRQWQKLFADERYSQTNFKEGIDFVKLADVYGIEGHKIEDLKVLERTLSNLDFSKPNFIQCNIDKNYDVFPMVVPNKSISTLIYD